MKNEYNESLFWKVFKNKYLLNYILKNKCCHKSKKFKTITSIHSMLKHKQYQLLICKLKANEDLYYKDKYSNARVNNEIKDIELFKEINYRDVEILFDKEWTIKSVVINKFAIAQNDKISTKELISLCDMDSFFENQTSSKWEKNTSDIIDNDIIVTIKDKETIDWLSDIETGGCSILNIRNALNSKLKQMKIEFSTLELLEYSRIKFKQVIPILDSNKDLYNIHILHTHDYIESLINGFNQSNFKNYKYLFKYYMIQIIQFGSKNSIKYLRLICDSIDELLIEFFFGGQKEEFKENKIPTLQTCQIINLYKIKVNFNHFPNETSYLFQTFIELLNFEGVQFILDNLNGKGLELNEKAFKDRFQDRIYSSKYLYKDLMEMIQFLIDKFKDDQLSLSNLSLILNYLFLKLIRVNNLTINQIKTAHQLISNFIEINRSKYTSYYYLKTLSPIIASCITTIKDPKGGFEKETSLCDYYIDTSEYTFEHLFKNRNNNDLNQFIHSTIMDIVKDNNELYQYINSIQSYHIKDNFSNQKFKMLDDNNNPRINLFLHYFEIELKFRKEKKNQNNLLQQYGFYFKRENNNIVNSEQEDSNDSEQEYANDSEQEDSNDDSEQEYANNSEQEYANDCEQEYANDDSEQEYANNSEQEYANDSEQEDNDENDSEQEIGYHEREYINGCWQPLSNNMVEWLGRIKNKDYSDYPDIIIYLFNKYKHQLKHW
ncbi:hypothetical protein ACTFIZ_010128 [Dictyostelium cf. discoideum]